MKTKTILSHKMLAGMAGVSLMAVSAVSSVSAQEADVRPDAEIVAEQYLIMGSATRGSGESQVAVNPLNPNQIAICAMGVLNNNEGKFEHKEFEFRRANRAVICQFAISRDRGLTWTILEDPMRDYFKRWRFLDPFADFAADGTLILGGEAHFPVNPDPAQQIDEAVLGAGANFGGVDIVLSTDGGRTFSQPIEIFSSYLPKEVFGSYTTQSRSSPPGDAPKIKIDRSNGSITMIGRIDAEDPKRGTMILRTSKDRARSWGMVYAMDNPEWLSGGGGTHDTASGMLAVCYIASKVPAELNVKAPCLVFETSKDDGKTFDRHVVPGTSGMSANNRSGGIVYADPSKAGRFVIVQELDNQVRAFVTEDSGMTWAAPKVVAPGPGTQIGDLAGRFNDRGELGLSWRVIYHDPKLPVVRRSFGAPGGAHAFITDPDTSEIWSALSRDGGKTFSAPLKVSTAPSPGISRRRGAQNHSPDFDSVTMDHDFVHLTWFDNRAGFLGTWYGRVPLNDYK